MTNTIDPNFKPASDQLMRLMDTSWKRVLEVAHNHIHFGDRAHARNSMDTTSTRSSSSTRSSNTSRNTTTTQSTADYSQAGLYERERQMVSALDTLFALVYEGPGYLAFISTITGDLEYENPICMAFLNHVIDKSSLPNRETMLNISLVIMDKINKKATRIQRMLSVISNKHKMDREDLKNEALRKQLVNIQSSSTMAPLLTMEQIKIKRNACTIWSLLAEKHAGDSCLLLWNDDVRDLCFQALLNPQEDLSVRIYSLLALEKFALTGAVKKLILAHDIDIRSILKNIVLECEVINKRIYLYSKYKNMNSISAVPPLFYAASKLTEAGQIYPFTSLNCFNTGFVPGNTMLLQEWAKYVQLGMLCRWSLDHTFKAADNSVTCPWDLSHASVIMNPFDSTAHMKIGGNGLELRNDRPFFESIRATACVKSGKWYYETLVLTGGIMQIGWATARCRFSPEDGHGVGDDCNGFALDVFRSSIWADGIAVYPKTHFKQPCKPGDVVGTLLDLDNGSSTFFINGKDVGLHVTFEHPNERKKRELLRLSMASDTSSLPPSTPCTPMSTESDVPMSPMSGVSTKSSRASSRRSSQKQTNKKLGLYPAISLTTNQHVLVNFGDRSWMCPPETNVDFNAVCNAGCLDEAYIRRVHRWVKKHGLMSRGPSPLNMQPFRPLKGADLVSPSPEYDSEESEDDDDDDMPRCMVCCAEAPDTVLLPCNHGQIGRACAGVLDICPLCRSEIQDRVTT